MPAWRGGGALLCLRRGAGHDHACGAERTGGVLRGIRDGLGTLKTGNRE